ncbi:MAG: 1-deoxy-D-xylulose-5-phosphate synthase [Phycisphaeraceae bacterium]|nr:1-deoxy-D-xylulose-5-phosphate synthase [Phycisphaeraceae bacterium]
MTKDSSVSSKPILPTIGNPADLRRLNIDQLPQLAAELRRMICEQVAKTGGHLASNLCVVELTIALHYVFDFSHDRLLWDVGHQCYPHKLLTGRQHLFPKLKKRDGMAGFPEPRESSYDLFSVGHAGTSISTAVGMALADTLQGEPDRRAVSLIGDASIVNGVAMEGLNSAGTLNRQFLVVLNDNGMAIAPPQGAVAHYLDRVRVNPAYGGFKKRARQVLQHVPGGDRLEILYHRAGEMMKAAILDDHMFKEFGLLCLGPVDGHDIKSLIAILNEVQDFDAPVLLHCKTIKGKGFDFSEQDAFAYHSPSGFVVQDCRVEQKKSSGRSFTKAFSAAMVDVMAKDDKVFAVTAAMPDGTGVDKLMEQYPKRTIDVGLCESNAMDICAGMAKGGIKPFFAVYSSFSQRALDQVFQEIALHDLPVRVCMDRAGYVGGDGAVMHGFMDISMFKVFPTAVLLAPSDEPTFRAALEFMRGHENGPSFIRYPRGNVPQTPLHEEVAPFQLGKAELVMPSTKLQSDIALLAYGTQVYEAVKAIGELASQGYDVALYDARFAKPVDTTLLRRLVESDTVILTIEDHALCGGFGASVLEACSDLKISSDSIYRMGMPAHWVYQDTRDGQLEQAGLDAAAIARRVREILDRPTGAKVDIQVGIHDAEVMR